MLVLCLMLSMTYYAQNYAGIIGGSATAAGYYNNDTWIHACSEVATSHVRNWQSLFMEDL